MKRFILISLMALLTVPMMACGWYGSDNIYLYRIYDSKEFSERVNDITSKNWIAYLGLKEDYFYFQADKVIEAARKKNDALMVSYVQNLQKYLDICNDIRYEQWSYPTKEKLAQRNQTLRQIQAYALSKVKTKLRSQHALLYMRCNMVLGLNRDNITFWEQTGSQLIETVYKDMMKNIYAGALYKMGRDTEAGEIFAEQGDYNSLMTQFYKRRSFEAIRQEYQRNPNAGVLPFLLQDFVNNTQEMMDDNLPGKLFIRNISTEEALRMAKFAGQVVKEGKTNNPAMWKAAQGWLEYLSGEKQQAYQDIQAATHMAGSEHAQLTARIINFYIKAAMDPLNAQFDAWLAQEIKWFEEPDSQHGWFKDNAMTRTVNQILAKKYSNRPFTLMGLYQITGNYMYETKMETMKVEDLEQFVAFTKGASDNPLDAYLIANIQNDPTSLDELIGTKHMRVAQWEKAISYLERVPVSFYNNRNYSIYAINRSVDVAPWITRQWLSDADYEKTVNLKSNYKLDFARQMLAWEKEAEIMKGDAQCQRYYDLAVRYAQACNSGDCWYLTHNGKSTGDDVVGENEKDFNAIARQLLQKASKAKDKQLKEKVLFGLSYYYLNPTKWSDFQWNSESSSYDFIIHPESSQYQALQVLVDFEKANGNKPSAFVSNCDIYTTFLYRTNQK